MFTVRFGRDHFMSENSKEKKDGAAKETSLKAEILSIYITAGALTVYREWLTNGKKEPREKLDAYLQRLTIACVREALQ